MLSIDPFEHNIYQLCHKKEFIHYAQTCAYLKQMYYMKSIVQRNTDERFSANIDKKKYKGHQLKMQL